MASKVKVRPTPTITYNACKVGIDEGRSQKEIAKELGISKVTLTAHLKKRNTSWALLTSIPGNKVTGKGKGEESKVPPTDKKGPPEDSKLPKAISLEMIEQYIIKGLMGYEVQSNLINIALKFLQFNEQINPTATTMEVEQASLKSTPTQELLTAMLGPPLTEKPLTENSV